MYKEKNFRVCLINGPNMNMLGIREKSLYGNGSYSDLIEKIKSYCDEKGIFLETFQSNHEGAIVDKIQSCYENFDGIVINPAAFTHTSVAILDALKSVNLPAIEVHITDTDIREDFRKISYPSFYCELVIKGRGFDGYIEAIEYLAKKYK